MSYTILTLLTRNLRDVFGENDAARRRAAIDEIYTEDCVFYEPKGTYRGREIDRVAGAIKATHPDFQYQPIAPSEELGNTGRIQWVSGRPGEPPAYAGTDHCSGRQNCRPLPLFRQGFRQAGTRLRSRGRICQRNARFSFITLPGRKYQNPTDWS
jgi:hypothetical protein